ncbi:cytochrome P450 1A1-like [Discoglossus pictus]
MESVFSQFKSNGISLEVAIAVLVFSTIFFIRKLRKSSRFNLPGPWTLPIVGNFFQLGDQIHISLTEMRKRYGDVYLIKLGMMPVVVVSGMDTVKKVLIKQGEHFADRPNIYSFSLLSDGKSMTFSEKYGENWKIHKKIMKNALRTLSKSDANSSNCSCCLEEYVCAEASNLMANFKEISAEKGAFDPSSYITLTVANVVCALCFGKRYDHHDKDFLSIVEVNHDIQRVSGGGFLADFIPGLRFLPSPAMKAVKKFIGSFNNFISSSVQEHYASYDENHIRDITDALIQLCNETIKEEKKQQLTEDQIIASVADIFGAGFDTVSSALMWTLLYLLQYPKIQEKIHKEIDEKIGCTRSPRFDDRKELHYTEAFINEVLRHSSPVPFTIPHCATMDTKLNGYFIPKDTCIFVNMYQVNHDSTIWKDPDLFMPERFLDENGCLDKTLIEKVLIFGMGVRKCIGEDLARNEMFVILATILQQLKLMNGNKSELDLTPVYGLTMKPKPYNLIAQLRT